MTTATSTNNGSHFARRVSFNNLNPPCIEKEFIFSGLGNGSPVDPNFRYGNALFNEFNQDIWKYKPPTVTKKRLKLPDPPAKSILKNGHPESQIKMKEVPVPDLYLDNGSDHEVDELSPRMDTSHISQATSESAPRRKSYSQMTDEELMALDPQFQLSKSKSNFEAFKFDSKSTCYGDTLRRTPVVAALPPKSVYPSSNEDNYNMISLTVKHDQYDSLSQHRTLLTIISGRSHTWSSLDWMFQIDKEEKINPFLEHGDSIVIACYIPGDLLKENNKRKEFDDMVYKKCQSLLDYVVTNVPNELKVKITVEMVSDINISDYYRKKLISGSKYMLLNLFKQHHPTLLVLGSKTSNMNFKYPRQVTSKDRAEYLMKISSYAVKYSSVPVVLVNSKSDSDRKPSQVTITFSNASHSDDNSIDLSVVSSEMSAKVENLMTEDNEDKFKNMLTTVSHKSLEESKTYLESINSKDDNVKIDHRIHAIYTTQSRSNNVRRGSNNSDKIYRVKSLLSVEDDEEDNARRIKLARKKLAEKARLEEEKAKEIEIQREKEKEKEDKKSKKSSWKKLFKK